MSEVPTESCGERITLGWIGYEQCCPVNVERDVLSFCRAIITVDVQLSQVLNPPNDQTNAL